MNLSPPVSRLSAIGLLILLAGIILFYIVLPLYRYYGDLLNDASFKQAQLARYQTLLAREEYIDAELAEIEAAGAASDLFIAGSKPAIASANLREFIAEAVRDSDGYLVSSQEYEVESPEFTTAIGLQVQAKGEVENLLGLLYTLEDSRPLMFIEELDIASSNARVVTNRPKRHERDQGREYSLEIQLNVVGYMLASEDTGDGREE